MMEVTSTEFRRLRELTLENLCKEFLSGSEIKPAGKVYDAASKLTLLHVAAERDETEKVHWLLENGADIHAQDSMLRTPLHYATLANAEKSTELLLTQGADPNSANKYKAYPIHYAAGAGNEKTVRLLLKFGAKVAVVDRNESTPLHSAVVTCSLGPIEPLCEHGCDKEAKDCHGSTALHVAARLGNPATPVVAELLDKGCNPNAVDNEGRTPLFRAAAAKSSASVYRLVEAGAHVGDAPTTHLLALHYPEMLSAVFNARITAKRYADSPTAPLEKVTLDHSCFLKQAASIVDPSSSKSISGPYAILKHIANSDHHQSTLAHPLVKSFLLARWASARKFAYMNFLFTLLTHSVLTFVGFSTKSPLAKVVTISEGGAGVVVQDAFSTGTSWLPIAALTCIAILTAREAVSLMTKRTDYFKTTKNYLDLAWLTSGLVISVDTWLDHTVLDNYSHQVAALAVIIGSFETMIAFGSCWPMFGEYVIIFMVVVKNFVVYSAAYLSLIIGFGLGFHVLFPWKEGFRFAWTSIARVFVMMSGELDFNSAFFEEASDGGKISPDGGDSSASNMAALVGPVSMVVFLLFVVIMSVILMNLLIGLTVSDIQALSYQAQSSRLAVLLDTLIETEWLVKATEGRNCCCFHRSTGSGTKDGFKKPSAAAGVGCFMKDDDMHKMSLDASPKGNKKYGSAWKQVLEESIRVVEEKECKDAEKAATALKASKEGGKATVQSTAAGVHCGIENLKEIQSSLEALRKGILALDEKLSRLEDDRWTNRHLLADDPTLMSSAAQQGKITIRPVIV